LPVEKVDIIISEWMGYFLLYEAMLDTVLFARDKWLAKDGIMLPDRCTINIAAIEDSSYKKTKLGFWDDVYGINMSCIKQAVVQEPLIDIFNKNQLNSSICKILDIDLYTVKKEELCFSSQYELTFFRRDTLNAIVTWFDCFFDKLPNKVQFSTGPFSKNTHWKQVIFYTDKDIYVEKSEVLKGSIAVRKDLVNFRALDIKLSFHFEGQNGKYDWYQLFKLR